MMKDQCVDLLYVACNRREFTVETFSALLANTDWRYIRQLFVYDDGSRDGTGDWLRANYRRCPSHAIMLQTRYGSPVAVMNDFIRRSSALILAKCDNDAMLPPSWLRQSLDCLDRHPELSMLGIEAMYPHSHDVDQPRDYTPAQFISGLGLYRRDAFAVSKPVPFGKWFGLEEWQTARQPFLRCGWITPAIPVFLLDRMPVEPWKSYASDYVRRGWQREWPKYDPACTLWSWHRPDGQPGGAPIATALPRCGFRVVILSANAKNLVPCVQAILENEPSLSAEDIIVIDDGARAEAADALDGVQWLKGIRPFVFARNANLGIRAASSDVVLINDDARLVVRGGFSEMSKACAQNPRVGLCSAAIRGLVGNPNQLAGGRDMRLERRTLAFVCVYVPRQTINRIGLLDERFVGYGFDDNDYSRRTLAAGLNLAISEKCVVDHSGSLPSTYRAKPDVLQLTENNRKLFYAKYGDSGYGRRFSR